MRGGQGGFIWLFYGSEQLPVEERPPIPMVPELEDSAWKPVRPLRLHSKVARVALAPAFRVARVAPAPAPRALPCGARYSVSVCCYFS